LLLNQDRTAHILLRSSWQTCNIGDVGHTPGVIRLLREHLPAATVTLWPTDVGQGVREMLQRRFVGLNVVETSEEIEGALRSHDLLVHGSASGMPGVKEVERWREQTGKPYGFFGISLFETGPRTVDLLNGAAFVFLRDSVSLHSARRAGVRCPVLEFGPDGAFAADVRDAASADRFLRDNHLEPGRFLCCIPRWRYTPYWEIRRRSVNEDHARRNAAMKEHDHRPLRDAIIEVVQRTNTKVLICPEDETQIRLGKEMIFDRLPDDVRRHVIWRDHFWRTDEAISVYRRSLGVCGLEMHSPIMSIGNGIPALVCRFAEQTSKGFMWRDLGLEDWLFDMDDEDQLRRLTPTVMSLIDDPQAARDRTAGVVKRVELRHREMVQIIADATEGALTKS